MANYSVKVNDVIKNDNQTAVIAVADLDTISMAIKTLSQQMAVLEKIAHQAGVLYPYGDSVKISQVTIETD